MTDRLEAILARMLLLHPKEIDLSLDRITRLLEALGRPDRRLPPVIHVAGTNGKGSVTAFLRAILEAAGLRVHVYTSPHLVNFRERIRLGAATGSAFVDDDQLIASLLEVERVNGAAPITHFEITTAAAMRIFAEVPADVMILEVGLGGRLDATNVVEQPMASVITPIAIDHERFLGDTVEAIAAEKAGIMKPGIVTIVGPQESDALTVIERRAAELRSPLAIANQDWQAYPERGRMVFQDVDGLLDLPPPNLIGRHQYSNAGIAIATIREAKLDVPSEAMERGLQSAYWPARMQRLTEGLLVDAVSGRMGEVWLDGGHNAGAAAAVAEVMADLHERAPRPLHLIMGMIDTKNPATFLEPFGGLVRSLVAVPVPGHAGHDPSALAAAATAVGIKARTAESVDEALAVLAEPAGARVLICGSLYLAGEVLERNGTPPA